MAVCCQVVSVSRWSCLSQRIPVLLQVCIWSFLLDNTMCSSLGGLVVCVSCATPTYTHAHGRISSFASITTLVNTNASPTPMLTRTMMTSAVSARTSTWSMSPHVKIRYHSTTSTKVVTPESTLTKVVAVSSAKSSVRRVSLDTQTSSISYPSNKSSSDHEITVSYTSSVEYQVASVKYKDSSVGCQAKLPECCSGECRTTEGVTKLPTKDERFQLTLPIKYGFLAAGMAVPFIICIFVAVFANYRFQRQMQRQKRARALNNQRSTIIHLGLVKANENTLTVPGRELIPLNTIRREAHINYACSEENVDRIPSAQV